MERFKLGILSQVKFSSEKIEPGIMELVTHNICAGGAFFKTPNPLPKGTRVSLLMTVQLNENGQTKNKMMSIEISGTVVRTEKDGMAIKFDNGYKLLPLGKKARAKRS